MLYGVLNGKSLQHLTIQEIKKIKELEFYNYKKIAFVRNPFDRIISEYFWRIENFGKKMIIFKDFLVAEVIPRKNVMPKVMKNFYRDENDIVRLSLDNNMDGDDCKKTPSAQNTRATAPLYIGTSNENVEGTTTNNYDFK